jgi:hypothetical protein
VTAEGVVLVAAAEVGVGVGVTSTGAKCLEMNTKSSPTVPVETVESALTTAPAAVLESSSSFCLEKNCANCSKSFFSSGPIKENSKHKVSGERRTNSARLR